MYCDRISKRLINPKPKITILIIITRVALCPNSNGVSKSVGKFPNDEWYIAGKITAASINNTTINEIRKIYLNRRNTLVEGFNRIGWNMDLPLGTMFVWAPIPERFKSIGSLEFSKILLKNGKVAVAPGIGFGSKGEGFVRIGLVENEHRIRQAIKNVKIFFDTYGN